MAAIQPRAAVGRPRGMRASDAGRAGQPGDTLTPARPVFAAVQALVALALIAGGCAVPASRPAGHRPAATSASEPAGFPGTERETLRRLFPGFDVSYGGTPRLTAAAAPRSAALPGANDLLVAGPAILAATASGIWRSADGGISWRQVLGGLAVSALTAVPGGGYAALGSRPSRGGQGPAMLAISTDGVHWRASQVTARTAGLPYPFGFGYRFALSSLGRHGIGIAVPDAIWTFAVAPPLRSTDGGRTWAPVAAAGHPPRGASDGVAMTDGGRIWYVTAPAPGGNCSGAVWRSTDAGRTWSVLRGSCQRYPLLAVQFIGPGRGFAAGGLTPKYGGGQVVEYTADGGRTWRTLWRTRQKFHGTPATGFVRLDMVSARRGWAIAGGCTGGQNGPCGGAVYVTSDGARRWRLTGQPATGLAGLDPDGIRAIAADNESATTAVTSDGGRTWATQTRPGWIRATAFAGIGSAQVWTTSLGDYVSTSAGARWTREGQLLASRFVDETWLAAPPDRLLGVTGDAGLTLAVSGNGGRSFTASRLPGRPAADMTLTAALGTGGTAIAVTGAGADCLSAAHVRAARARKPDWQPPSAASTLFTSSDGGSHWNRTGSVLPFGVGTTAAAAVDGRGAAIVDACNRLQISQDGGRRWHAEAIGKDVFCAVSLRAQRGGPAELWLSCQSGPAAFWLLHSADGGRTWTGYRLPLALVTQGKFPGSPAGTADLAVVGLAAVRPRAAVLPAGGSVWRTSDGGRSWAQSWPALASSGHAG